MFLGLSLVLPALLPAQGLEATFADLKGEVEWSAAGSTQWEAASANTVLHAGDRVRTLGNSSARLAYFEGSATALAAATSIRIDEMRNEADLRLLRLTQETGATQGQVQEAGGIPTNYEVTSASAVMLAPPRTPMNCVALNVEPLADRNGPARETLAGPATDPNGSLENTPSMRPNVDKPPLPVPSATTVESLRVTRGLSVVLLKAA